MFLNVANDILKMHQIQHCFHSLDIQENLLNLANRKI